jgi:bacillithiol biosynthesis cysteine-adding enzyme BshC
MKYIDYRDLPQQTNLFLDYIYDYEKVSKYYNGNFRSNEDIFNAIETASTRNINRPALVEILLHQNEHLNDLRAIENIKRLLEPNTVAIVTGQQLGLLSGPLYTIYKILTILKLTEKYNENYRDYKFVPVFWLEGDDHDFFEINKVKIIDKQNHFFTHEFFLEGKPVEKNYGATGEIILDSYIEKFLNNILNTLNFTEYHDNLKNLLFDSYKNTSSIRDCFCTFIQNLIKNSGIIFINPGDPKIKKMLKPLFDQEIISYPKTSELIINLSADLEEIYHAQVKARPINLFMFHTKGRYPLEPYGEDYTLKGIRQKYTKLEIIEKLNSTPEVFSPNVILRPICQDYLLPTFCYVAGPSEIAYYAQFKPIYEFFNVKMPLIYPRASITIIENKIQKILDKFNLRIIDLFTNYEGVVRKVTEQVSNIKIDFIFNEIDKVTNPVFENLQNTALLIDKTLINNVESSKEKVQHYFNLLKEKIFEAQKRNNKIALEQIEKTLLYLFPKNNFQEREINIIYFLNKYNLNFINTIREELDVELFNHQILEI